MKILSQRVRKIHKKGGGTHEPQSSIFGLWY